MSILFAQVKDASVGSLFAARQGCSEWKRMGMEAQSALYTCRGSTRALMSAYVCALVCDLCVFSTTLTVLVYEFLACEQNSGMN